MIPPNLQIDDVALKPIAEKVMTGERLSAEDGAALYRTPLTLARGRADTGRLVDVVVVPLQGDGVGLGRDHTIYAARPGVVAFSQGRKGRLISVDPAE